MRRAALILISLALMCLAAAAVGSIRDLVSDGWRGDGAAVRSDLDALGGWAALVLAAAILIHNVVPIPAELLNGAAGYVLGIAFGVPVCLAAWVLSGLLGYAIGAGAGRPLAERLLGADRMASLERVVARGGRRALLVLRMIPVLPFTGVSVVAGLARVPVPRFAWTTALGSIPLTVLAVVLGARLQSPRFDDPVLLGGLVALVAIVVLAPTAGRRLQAQ